MFYHAENSDLRLCSDVSIVLEERTSGPVGCSTFLPVVACNGIPESEKLVSMCGQLQQYSPQVICAQESSANPRTKSRLTVMKSTSLPETNEKICHASTQEIARASDLSLYNFRTRFEGSTTCLECCKLLQWPATDRDIACRAS